MPPDPTILAFDTSAAHCAAALLRGGETLETVVEPMARGQAERLMPMMQEILDRHRIGWSDLDALGVGTGPGNFTGIRISVAAARGLALALEVPAVGVSSLEALAENRPGQVRAVIKAPRETLFVQDFEDGAATSTAWQTDPDDLAPWPAEGWLAVGDWPDGSADLAKQPDAADRLIAIAQIAARRFGAQTATPVPYYVRSADAAPSAMTPPPMLDDR